MALSTPDFNINWLDSAFQFCTFNLEMARTDLFLAGMEWQFC